MAARKNNASNTIGATLLAFQKAQADEQLPFPWPQDVALPDDPEAADQALRDFNDVLRSKPLDSWAPVHAKLIAELTLLQLEIGKANAIWMAEGATVPNPKNPAYVVRHPALDATNMLTSQRTSLLKSLGLTGASFHKDVGAKSTRKAAGVLKQTRGFDPDGLLAS